MNSISAEWKCPFCGCQNRFPKDYSAIVGSYEEHLCKRCGQHISMKFEGVPKDLLIVAISGGLVSGIYTNMDAQKINLRKLDFDAITEWCDDELSEEDIKQNLREAERVVELAETELNMIY